VLGSYPGFASSFWYVARGAVTCGSAEL